MKGQLRNPVFAGILSAIIPGTGQIYNQEILKAWIVLILTIGLAGTVFGGIAVWLFAIVDAYLTAQKINSGKKKISLHRNSSLAAVSSIVCGWGQIYNGEALKGGLMLACLILLTPTGIGLIFMWLYSIIDSYLTAEKINRGEFETPLIKRLIRQRAEDVPFILKENPPPAETPPVTGRLEEKISLALEKEDYVRVIDYVQEVHRSSINPITHFHIGKAYLCQGNYGFASLELINALEKGDRRMETCNNLGLALLSYGNKTGDEIYFHEAAICFDHVLENDTFWQGEVNYINLLVLKRDFQEAKRRCENLLEGNPSLWQGKHSLAILHMEEGNDLKAKELFQEIIRENPDTWETRLALGNLYEKERDGREAVSVYRDILKMKIPQRVRKGVAFRIKRLNSPEKRILRLIWK